MNLYLLTIVGHAGLLNNKEFWMNELSQVKVKWAKILYYIHSLFNLFLFNTAQFHLHEGITSSRYLVKERENLKEREIL